MKKALIDFLKSVDWQKTFNMSTLLIAAIGLISIGTVLDKEKNSGCLMFYGLGALAVVMRELRKKI